VNRNRLLKQGRKSGPESAQIDAWDHELCLATSAIDESRTRYLERLLPVFQTNYEELMDNHSSDLQIIYKRGWSAEHTLDEVLASNKEVDFRYGSTQSGPHRADLDIKLGSRRAQDILSRGQEKLVVCALKVAQGEVLSQVVGRKCIYLIDDLPAELDASNREKVMQQLVQTSSQLFITSVEATAIDTESLGRSDIAKFHVERGILTG
jgi:DNA replication and repair protein RecF